MSARTIEVKRGDIHVMVGGQLTVYSRQVLTRYAAKLSNNPLWRQYLDMLDAEQAQPVEAAQAQQIGLFEQ